MDTIQIAVVGFGTMGRLYANILSQMEGVKLAAICSSSTESEIEAARLGARRYDSFEELMKESSLLDAIVLALPTYLHKAYAVAAADKGLHIICEKPVALTTNEAEEMTEACRRNHVNLFVGHVLRFFPDYAQLFNRVTDGEIGPVVTAHAKRYSLHPPSNSWFDDDAKSGGVLFDLMIHDIDYLHSMMGEADSVYAVIRKSPGMQYAAAILRFESGAVANLEAMWGYAGPFTTSLEVTGRDGMLRADNEAFKLAVSRGGVTAYSLQTEGVSIPQSSAHKDPYLLELEHFVSCIRTGAEPVVTAQDAGRAVATACAALESAWIGRPIKPVRFRKGNLSGSKD